MSTRVTRKGPVKDLLGARATRLLGRSVAGRKVRRRVTTVVRKTQFPLRAPAAPVGIEVRTDTQKTGADYPTDWARTPPAKAARAALVETVLRPIVAGLARPTRLNADRLIGVDGPVIFAPNHHSHVDTSLLLTSIPRRLRHDLVVAAAADYFFTNRVTSALSALTIGAIPIERQKIGRQSADLASDVLDDGWSLLIYPEGGRSKDGWGQPFRGGAAYLAIRAKVPVVPVYVAGTRRILRKGSAIPRPSRTTVNFGKPIWPLDGETSRRFAARIEEAVAVLGDEIGGGWYNARLRVHAGETPGLGGPSVSSWRRSWALGKRRAAAARTRPWPNV
jgi:1-acyl-sn-glycerol-3-phosphate acyltransferase